jgi:hypothetical protein
MVRMTILSRLTADRLWRPIVHKMLIVVFMLLFSLPGTDFLITAGIVPLSYMLYCFYHDPVLN